MSTDQRNKEPKKDQENPRNKYNETIQNQGQKIIKHKTEKSQKEASLEVLS
jgi:hypothetical protein